MCTEALMIAGAISSSTSHHAHSYCGTISSSALNDPCDFPGVAVFLYLEKTSLSHSPLRRSLPPSPHFFLSLPSAPLPPLIFRSPSLLHLSPPPSLLHLLSLHPSLCIQTPLSVCYYHSRFQSVYLKPGTFISSLSVYLRRSPPCLPPPPGCPLSHCVFRALSPTMQHSLRALTSLGNTVYRPITDQLTPKALVTDAHDCLESNHEKRKTYLGPKNEKCHGPAVCVCVNVYFLYKHLLCCVRVGVWVRVCVCVR